MSRTSRTSPVSLASRLTLAFLGSCNLFSGPLALRHLSLSARMDFQRGDSYGGTGAHIAPKEHHNTLIFMHGLGDTADGWTDFVGMLRRQRGVFSKTKFILPTATTRPISLNGGFPMPGWADIFGLSASDPEDLEGYTESVCRVSAMIDSEVEKGIPSERIVIGGFSQGGAVAYLTALKYPKTLGGVLALSSWLPLRNENPNFAAVNSLSSKTPILHCHGTADPMVDIKWGKATVEELKSKGFQIDLKTYPGMGHSACDEELSDAAAFLEQVFSTPSKN